MSYQSEKIPIVAGKAVRLITAIEDLGGRYIKDCDGYTRYRCGLASINIYRGRHGGVVFSGDSTKVAEIMEQVGDFLDMTCISEPSGRRPTAEAAGGTARPPRRRSGSVTASPKRRGSVSGTVQLPVSAGGRHFATRSECFTTLKDIHSTALHRARAAKLEELGHDVAEAEAAADTLSPDGDSGAPRVTYAPVMSRPDTRLIIDLYAEHFIPREGEVKVPAEWIQGVEAADLDTSAVELHQSSDSHESTPKVSATPPMLRRVRQRSVSVSQGPSLLFALVVAEPPAQESIGGHISDETFDITSVQQNVAPLIVMEKLTAKEVLDAFSYCQASPPSPEEGAVRTAKIVFNIRQCLNRSPAMRDRFINEALLNNITGFVVSSVRTTTNCDRCNREFPLRQFGILHHEEANFPELVDVFKLERDIDRQTLWKQIVRLPGYRFGGWRVHEPHLHDLLASIMLSPGPNRSIEGQGPIANPMVYYLDDVRTAQDFSVFFSSSAHLDVLCSGCHRGAVRTAALANTVLPTLQESERVAKRLKRRIRRGSAS